MKTPLKQSWTSFGNFPPLQRVINLRSFDIHLDFYGTYCYFFILRTIVHEVNTKTTYMHHHMKPLIHKYLMERSYRTGKFLTKLRSSFSWISQHFFCGRKRSDCVWYERQIWHRLSLVYVLGPRKKWWSYDNQIKFWIRVSIVISPENFHYRRKSADQKTRSELGLRSPCSI